MQETPFVALVSFVLAWAQTLSSGFTRRRFVRYLIWLAHLRWHSPPIWLAPNAWLSLLSCIAPLHVAVKLLGFRSSQMAPLTQLGSLQILGTLPARWLRSVAMALSCRLALTPRSRHPHGLWLAQAALAHSQALTRSACVAPSHNLTRSLALVPSRRPRLAHTHGTLTLVGLALGNRSPPLRWPALANRHSQSRWLAHGGWHSLLSRLRHLHLVHMPQMRNRIRQRRRSVEHQPVPHLVIMRQK